MNRIFTDQAVNVYRTEKYIVVQLIGIRLDSEVDNGMFSFDTYYLRNKKRDREYEKLYADKHHIDGRRIKTTMYSRTYVD